MEQSEGTPAYARFLRLGAVKHVSALRRHGGFETLSAVGVYPSLLARPILLLEVPGALPRTYVVGNARPGDGEAARQILLDPGFDPSREAVLPDIALQAGPLFSGTSRILDFKADRVRLEAEFERARAGGPRGHLRPGVARDRGRTARAAAQGQHGFPGGEGPRRGGT